MAIALKSMRVQLDDPRLLREQCYVGGGWIDADNRKTIAVTDPATGETVGTVPSLGVEEVRRAIAAAEAALPAWRGRTAKERAAILRRWFVRASSERHFAPQLTCKVGFRRRLRHNRPQPLTAR